MSEENQNNERQGLHNLVAPRGARRPIKRVGRGHGSGHGKTSGRGHKGQKARKSGGVRPGFEGGTLRLARRLPKRGFRNALFKVDYREINVGSLADRYEAGETVDLASLIERGLVSRVKDKVKILGEGEISVALTIRTHKISAGAKQKIEAAGGTVELVDSSTKKKQA